MTVPPAAPLDLPRVVVAIAVVGALCLLAMFGLICYEHGRTAGMLEIDRIYTQ